MDGLLGMEHTSTLSVKQATKWFSIHEHKCSHDCDIPGRPNLEVLYWQQTMEPSLPTVESPKTSLPRMCSTTPAVPCTHPQTCRDKCRPWCMQNATCNGLILSNCTPSSSLPQYAVPLATQRPLTAMLALSLLPLTFLSLCISYMHTSLFTSTSPYLVVPHSYKTISACGPIFLTRYCVPVSTNRHDNVKFALSEQ